MCERGCSHCGPRKWHCAPGKYWFSFLTFKNHCHECSNIHSWTYSFPLHDGGGWVLWQPDNLLLMSPVLISRGGFVRVSVVGGITLMAFKIFAVPAGFHRDQGFSFSLPLLTMGLIFSISLFSTQERAQCMQRVPYCIQKLRLQCPKFTESAVIEYSLLYFRHYFKPFTNIKWII